jgi:hypothetical protein
MVDERGPRLWQDVFPRIDALGGDALADRVAEAKRRAETGDAAEALALGRDLHWLSGDQPEREAAAADLLAVAYRALGRDALAGIVEAHHRHRALASVDVLEPRPTPERPVTLAP